jgi:hypothetical protein
MHLPRTRRRFLAGVGTATPALAIASSFSRAEGDAKAVQTGTITEGNLKVVLRDNARSPKVLSGLAKAGRRCPWQAAATDRPSPIR